MFGQDMGTAPERPLPRLANGGWFPPDGHPNWPLGDARWVEQTIRHTAIVEAMRANLKRVGSNYGGWTLFLPALNNKSAVVSIGLGNDISWDLELIRTTGCEVHGFDNTPTHNRWWRQQSSVPKGFHRHPFLLGTTDGTLTMALPGPLQFSYVAVQEGAKKTGIADGWKGGTRKNTQHTAPALTIYSMMRKLAFTRLDVLKMDVEGIEFRWLQSLINDPADTRPHAWRLPVCQLLIEFHSRYDEHGLATKAQALSDLATLGFTLLYNVRDDLMGGADDAHLINPRFCESQSTQNSAKASYT